MKTNKFLFLILLGLSTLLLQSCLKDQSDIFDKSSSLRMQETLDKAKETLLSSPNGWAFDYYPDRNLSYGGFAYTVVFDEDKATVECELADESESSYYRLTNDDGPVLSFDTYNSLMHLFATPSAGAYEADDGDFEFVIMDIQPDLITLRGKRCGNTMYLRKLDVPAHDYLQQVMNVSKKMNAKAYGLDINGKSYKVSRSLQVLTVASEEGDMYDLPFIVTPQGFKLYEPVEIDGKTIEGFSFSEEGRWTEFSDNSIVLYGVYPPLAEQLVSSPWFFAASKMSSKVLTYFKQAEAGSASEGETIGAMLLGPASGVKLIQSSRNYSNNFAFAFTSGNYAGALLYNYQIIDDHTIKIAFALQGEGDGVYYYNNCNYSAITTVLGSSAGKTYKLTADDDKVPSWIRMDQVEDPTVYWTLSSDVIRDPFNN